MKNKMKMAMVHIIMAVAALCGMFAISGCSNYDNASIGAGCGSCGSGCLAGCAGCVGSTASTILCGGCVGCLDGCANFG